MAKNTFLILVLSSLLGLTVASVLVAQQQRTDLKGQLTLGLVVLGASGATIDFIALPEKRIPTTGNDSTIATIEVRNPGDTDIRFSGSVVTTSNGTYSGLVISNIADSGTYDITVKGYSHLRKKKTSVTINSGMTIDFTDAGTAKLLSGDVNAASGDNKVNGIDLALIVSGLSGSDNRLDLNQDTTVNGIDLTNAVSNLNVVGDT